LQMLMMLLRRGIVNTRSPPLLDNTPIAVVIPASRKVSRERPVASKIKKRATLHEVWVLRRTCEFAQLSPVLPLCGRPVLPCADSVSTLLTVCGRRFLSLREDGSRFYFYR
jgi:hypothetical protein